MALRRLELVTIREQIQDQTNWKYIVTHIWVLKHNFIPKNDQKY